MNKTAAIFLFAMLCLFLSSEFADAHSIQKDTLYRIGNFLIHPTDTMNIDFIVKRKPHNQIISKGDTIYNDDRYLILGNSDKLGGYEKFGLFKKYKLRYKFSRYKVSIFKGKLALPDFRTDRAAILFRTQIKKQCKSEGINFAGHFTLAHWGCGSACERIAIVDRINGKIYYSNLIPLSKSIFYEVTYRSYSTMIIMNYWLLNAYSGYIFCSHNWPLEIAKWDNSKLRFLLESPVYEYDH